MASTEIFQTHSRELRKSGSYPIDDEGAGVGMHPADDDAARVVSTDTGYPVCYYNWSELGEKNPAAGTAVAAENRDRG